MDVTPRELRDIDIRERFGGYHKDDVDDLLERAAARIEALEGQLRVVQSQAEAGAADAGKTRDTEDMLHRTLLLAQRAADEAVAEAQSKARQILDDAESKSRSLVSEAETSARRQADTERRRLEGEVLELGAKREALVADVDALERFETDYRGRLRRAVETDLEMLSAKGSVAPSPRPTIHDVEMPPTLGSNITTEVVTVPSAPASVAPPAAPPAVTPAPVPPPAFGVAASTTPTAPAAAPVASAPVAPAPVASTSAPVPAPTPTFVAPPVPGAPSPVAKTEVSPPGAAPSAGAPPWEEAATPPISRPPLFDAEPEPEHLDDDAFFASLREAVTDETPLGPRDSVPGGDGFDHDDQRGGLFRRRGR